jgi:hypothetical protein
MELLGRVSYRCDFIDLLLVAAACWSNDYTNTYPSTSLYDGIHGRREYPAGTATLGPQSVVDNTPTAKSFLYDTDS